MNFIKLFGVLYGCKKLVISSFWVCIWILIFLNKREVEVLFKDILVIMQKRL